MVTHLLHAVTIVLALFSIGILVPAIRMVRKRYPEPYRTRITVVDSVQGLATLGILVHVILPYPMWLFAPVCLTAAVLPFFGVRWIREYTKIQETLWEIERAALHINASDLEGER